MVKVVVLELLSPIRSHPVRATKDESNLRFLWGNTICSLKAFYISEFGNIIVWTKSNRNEAYPMVVTSVGTVNANL